MFVCCCYLLCINLCAYLVLKNLTIFHTPAHFIHTQLLTLTTHSTTKYSHYSFYLEDGMSILELGAAENSYLPPNLKPNKHIGVGAISSQMDMNPSITKSYVIDLNTVIEDEGIDSKIFNDELIGSDGQGQFDAILMANTIDFLNSPREVFK